ncbi:hypothetical protein [Bradyrhizobium sp. USDA 4452]
MRATPILKEEFCARFKARMLETIGEKFDDGSSVAEYADETAPSYWEDANQRNEGPEECADADMSYWARTEDAMGDNYGNF